MKITRIDYDPGTISAPAFLDITTEDGNYTLQGKAAKAAYKTLRVGDDYDAAN